MNVVAQVKELVTEDRHRIKLHDLVSGEIQKVLAGTGEDRFSNQGAWSAGDFADRLKKYEAVTCDLRDVQALLGYWGGEANRATTTLALRRLAGRLGPIGGLSAWVSLRWYPVQLLLYVGGIAAVANENYHNLRALMHAVVQNREQSRHRETVVRAVVDGMTHVDEAFKLLSGPERNHVPRSEYLFKLLQPRLDNLFFLEGDYGECFDRFEVLLALEYADQCARERGGRVWGPVGRFGWKFDRGDDSSPLHHIMGEAGSAGGVWPPVRAGLFGGSADRFKEIAAEYAKGVGSLHWS